jgi:hypothetical protein
LPALICSRDANGHQETWLICYGDVHVSTIRRSIGNPAAAPQWQWSRGFYPGPELGECKNGTAASYEASRAAFLAVWRVFLSHRTDEHCDHAGHDQDTVYRWIN